MLVPFLVFAALPVNDLPGGRGLAAGAGHPPGGEIENGLHRDIALPIRRAVARGENVLPLLCQEACNILVAEARKVVKGE